MKRLLLAIGLCCTGCANTTESKLFKTNWNEFIRQGMAIEAVRTYNRGYVLSPYQIGSIPKTQFNWMQWHTMNVKLDKTFR